MKIEKSKQEGGIGLQVFMMDGVGYNVDVAELKREFSVQDTDNSGRTMDGAMYREPIGTYYNYTMTIRPKPGAQADMDAFWEAISQPVVSHMCTFPYNQQTLTQKMYVTGGEQALTRLWEKGTAWGEASISFIALRPAVSG